MVLHTAEETGFEGDVASTTGARIAPRVREDSDHHAEVTRRHRGDRAEEEGQGREKAVRRARAERDEHENDGAKADDEHKANLVLRKEVRLSTVSDKVVDVRELAHLLLVLRHRAVGLAAFARDWDLRNLSCGRDFRKIVSKSKSHATCTT